jgi:hypothetical protein
MRLSCYSPESLTGAFSSAAHDTQWIESEGDQFLSALIPGDRVWRFVLFCLGGNGQYFRVADGDGLKRVQAYQGLAEARRRLVER